MLFRSPPQMSTFDAPSRESCVMRRERTNTPLQALLLMNDPQYVEAARRLAERTVREGGEDVRQRAAYMLRLCTARHPESWEVDDVGDAFECSIDIVAVVDGSADDFKTIGWIEDSVVAECAYDSVGSFVEKTADEGLADFAGGACD